MVSFRSSLAASLILASSFALIPAVPLADKLQSLSHAARELLKTSTPAPPYLMTYGNNPLDAFPSSADLHVSDDGVAAISFLLPTGNAIDEALHWQDLTEDERNALLAEYDACGISLIVSAFGCTETPTTSGFNAVDTAESMAKWVKKYGAKGIDVDYEDYHAFAAGVAEIWLIAFTKALRNLLPKGDYILTHAPAAPWFSPSMWSGGGYLALDEGVGSLIDWYNVQFYNEKETEYVTCQCLLNVSSSDAPESALFQIAGNGVSLDKLVIGKPATPTDSKSGYVDPLTLAACVAEAAKNGWNAGVMVWQYPHVTLEWIKTVRGSTWPLEEKKA